MLQGDPVEQRTQLHDSNTLQILLGNKRPLLKCAPGRKLLDKLLQERCASDKLVHAASYRNIKLPPKKRFEIVHTTCKRSLPEIKIQYYRDQVSKLGASVSLTDRGMLRVYQQILDGFDRQTALGNLKTPT